MSEPERIEFAPAEAAAPFPLPRWARATAFVGFYALVLAGMVELEDALQALLAWFGMESSGLDRTGVLAGLYVALMGLPPLLYVPIERNEGLYRMACSLAAALSALAVAVLTLVVIDLSAPAFAESFVGSMAPLGAALVTLAIGALATKIAIRRRDGMAGAVDEAGVDGHE